MVQNSTFYKHNEETLDALLEEVRLFIDRVQSPRLKDSAWVERMRQAGEELSLKAADFAAHAGEKHAAVCEALKLLAERLTAYSGELAGPATQQALRDRGEMLARSYEEFLIELKKRQLTRASTLIQTLRLKPANYVRNIFHSLMGLIGVICYYFFLTRPQALAILGTLLVIGVILETGKRYSEHWNRFLMDKVFAAISRPSERYRINSATLYLTALTLIVFLFPKLPVLAATLVLAFSDPAASIIGKRWGVKKLYRDKSLAGTIAFFGVGVLAAGGFLLMAVPDLGLLRIIAVAAAIAATGAVTELFSSRIDDNFSIPVACTLVGVLLL